jgi:hypothetical protein
MEWKIRLAAGIATAPFRDEQFHEFGLSAVHMALWQIWKATCQLMTRSNAGKAAIGRLSLFQLQARPRLNMELYLCCKRNWR